MNVKGKTFACIFREKNHEYTMERVAEIQNKNSSMNVQGKALHAFSGTKTFMNVYNAKLYRKSQQKVFHRLYGFIPES